MEEFLDNIWFKIIDLCHHIRELLDILLAPLNLLGPAINIFAIAFITVVITKILTKTIKTKRYERLKEEFVHWYNLRKEALRCEDGEKARLLAKNIDKGKLNKVYYDFFVEGFLLSLLTKYIPILSILAYVNEAYRPENLLKLFGRNYIFKFRRTDGGEILVGAVFWFLISVILIYIGWALLKKIYKKLFIEKKRELDPQSSSGASSLPQE